ncbi:MAG: hypothetical protein KGL39_04035 [Patescibacteria group bacterium]|nr:hypothetical protein [Patescibacteria group bacterium]
MTDLDTVKLAVQLSKAAYGDGGTSAVSQAQALGFDGITSAHFEDVNALICRRDGRQWVAASGTHFSENPSLSEIADNLKGDPLSVGGGAVVHSGYWGRALRLWWYVRPLLEGPVVFCGHSLGGATSHLMPYFAPRDLEIEVVTCGAPKSANDAFWQTVYRKGSWIRIVREHDFAPTWPESMADILPPELTHLLSLHGTYSQPGLEDWLHNRTFNWIAARPGWNGSVPDHDVDLYLGDTMNGTGFTGEP